MADHPAQSSTEALLAQAGWVRGLALRLVGRSADAEDAVQATWLATLENPPRLRASPRAWLRTVLRNVVARSSRRSDLAAGAEARHERRPDAEPAADVIQRAELHRKLVDHVMALDEPHRATILMHYFDGLPLAEIARRLGVPEGTVRSRHHRAVEALRDRLESQRADWRAMVLPLAGVPGALPIATVAGVTKAAAEVLAMTWKAKVGIGVAALSAAALVTLVLSARGLFDRDPEAPADPAAAIGPAAGGGAPPADATRAPPGATRPIAPGSFRDAESFVLRGRVRRADGAALEDGRVMVVRFDQREIVEGDAADDPAGFPRSASTAPTGEFRLELKLAAPGFVVYATAKGCAPRDVVVWPERESGPVDVVLESGGTIEGVVQSLERTPVPNATLGFRWYAGGIRGRRETRSGEDGRYRLDGIPRRFEYKQTVLAVAAAGFAPLSLVDLQPPDESGLRRQDLFLTRGATIKGTVVDADTGAPLAGARVFFWGRNEVSNPRRSDGTTMSHPDYLQVLGEVAVNPDGSFVFEKVPSWGVHEVGSHRLDAQLRPLGGLGAIAPGHATRNAEVFVPAEGSIVEVVLRCKPAVVVQGRVVDPEGRPVAGAQVWRSADPDEDDEGWFPRGLTDLAPRTEVETDVNGRYVLTGVPASNKTEARVRVSAYGSTWPQTKECSVEALVSGAGPVAAPDLVLAADFGRSAVVRVTTETGAPVWGAAILDGVRYDAAIARTDREGMARIRLPYAPEDRQLFVVRAPGFAQEGFDLAFHAGSPAEATVVLRPGHSVSGTVCHPDGSMAAGARVNVDGAASRPLPQGFALPNATVRANGAFEIADLPAGPYRLTVHESLGHVHTTATAEDVPEGPGARLVVARPLREPGGRVEVTCLEKGTRRAIIRCLVELVRDDDWRVARAQAPGEFGFREVPQGEWRLRVSPEGFMPEERAITVAADAVTKVEVAASKGVRLKGRLLHPAGKTFVNPRLLLTGSKQLPTLEADGSFEIQGLAPGSRLGFTVFDRSGHGRQAAFVSRQPLAIPADRSEIAAEIPMAGGGPLTVFIEGEKLFKFGEQNDERNDLIRRSRLELRDSNGELVLPQPAVWDNWGDWFPVGRYTLRLEVPGCPVQEKTVEVTGNDVEVRFKVE